MMIPHGNVFVLRLLFQAVNTLFLRYFVCQDGYLSGSLTEILRTVFTAIIHLHHIVVVVPRDATTSDPLFDVFQRILPKGGDAPNTFHSFVCHRHDYFAMLHIRDSRVEDHDDLMPIFNKHAAALKTEFGEFFLSELIEAQDENNKCIVADVDGTAVGFMSVTTDIDAGMLTQYFELEAYNELVGGGKHASSSDNAAEPYSTTKEPVIERKLSSEHLVRSRSQSSAESLEDGTQGCCSLPGSAFGIQLFCIEDKFEMRSMDFLTRAFQLFPDKDFAIITIPSTCFEFPLLHVFQRIPPKPCSLFSQELYVFHRHALFGDMLQVRLCVLEDEPLIQGLVSNIDNSKEVLRQLKAFNDARRDQDGTPILAFAAECLKQIVGLCIIQNEQDTDYIRSHYNIEDFIYFSHHDRDEHGHLYHFVLNPLFQHMEKHFLKEVLRLSNKSSLYYPVYSGSSTSHEASKHSLVSCLNSLVPIRARRQIKYPLDELGINGPTDKVMQEKEKYALYHINKKLTLEPKLVNNTRIVVVGASDVAMAFLESILFCPHLCFNNITLISPDGIPDEIMGEDAQERYFPSSLCYTRERHREISLRTWLTVVKAKVVAIERAKKSVLLDGGSRVLYDTLLLCTGRQFSLPVPTEADVTRFETTQEALKRRLPSVCKTQVPKNVFLHNASSKFDFFVAFVRKELSNTDSGSVIVYGASMEAYTCINGLLEDGVSGDQICLVKPPHDAPSCFNDPQIEQHMEQALSNLGVSVHTGYTLARWNHNCSDVNVCNASFTSDTKPITLPCKAFVCCHTKTVDYNAFTAMNESCLVFDGKLVIDTEFRTNDPAIRAAGSLTKYSRRYHCGAWSHTNYSSKEVGTKLADKMLAVLDPTLAAENAITQKSDDVLIPLYDEPKVVSARLPGGHCYLNIAKPSLSIPLQSLLAQPDYGQELVTGGEENGVNYFRLHLNHYKAVETITCLSKEPFDASNLVRLYGLNERLLNNLLQRFHEGLIKDLYSFFREPWSLAIYHDRFADFRSELRDILASQPLGHGTSLNDRVVKMIDEDLTLTPSQRSRLMDNYVGNGYKRMVERRLLSFLRYNGYHLPMYASPGMVA